MSKTNYLQAVISDLQRTAGPYRCANQRHNPHHSIKSSTQTGTYHLRNGRSGILADGRGARKSVSSA